MELTKLNSAELVDKYNEAAVKLGKKKVKRFANKEAGLKRTEAILAELGNSKPKAAAPKKEKAPAQKKEAKQPKAPKVIDWPYTGPGEGKPAHAIRNGSLGARFVELLKKGTNREELAKAVEAHDKDGGKPSKDPVPSRVQSALRMLHSYNGYGVKEAGTGTLRLVTK